jgi:hypothetical protein
MHLAPGRHSLRAVVRVDESGRIGFQRHELDVPHFDAPRLLPPIAALQADRRPTVYGPHRGDDYAYPFAVQGYDFVPRNEPLLSDDGTHRIVLTGYRLPVEGLSVTPSIISGEERHPANVVLVGRTAMDEQGAVKLLFEFRPEHLPAGSHQLRFDVTTADGKSQSVSMPFTLQ